MWWPPAYSHKGEVLFSHLGMFWQYQNSALPIVISSQHERFYPLTLILDLASVSNNKAK